MCQYTCKQMSIGPTVQHAPCLNTDRSSLQRCMHHRAHYRRPVQHGRHLQAIICRTHRSMRSNRAVYFSNGCAI